MTYNTEKPPASRLKRYKKNIITRILCTIGIHLYQEISKTYAGEDHYNDDLGINMYKGETIFKLCCPYCKKTKLKVCNGNVFSGYWTVKTIQK